AAREDINRSRQNAYQECMRRLDGLVKLQTSPGNADGSLLSAEEYGRQRRDLLKEKAALEALLRDAGESAEEGVKRSEEALEFACTARTRFAQGDARTRKEILATIGSNLTLRDKILSIEARKPFLILAQSNSDVKSENGPIEPENNGLPSDQN